MCNKTSSVGQSSYHNIKSISRAGLLVLNTQQENFISFCIYISFHKTNLYEAKTERTLIVSISYEMPARYEPHSTKLHDKLSTINCCGVENFHLMDCKLLSWFRHSTMACSVSFIEADQKMIFPSEQSHRSTEMSKFHVRYVNHR